MEVFIGVYFAQPIKGDSGFVNRDPDNWWLIFVKCNPHRCFTIHKNNVLLGSCRSNSQKKIRLCVPCSVAVLGKGKPTRGGRHEELKNELTAIRC